MVRRLEGAVIEWLRHTGIAAYGKAAAPGVYVARGNGEAKIAALGLKVRNGCTYHGLAVNVAMDLAPFADIDPCGYPGLAVTQLADLGVEANGAQAAGESSLRRSSRMHPDHEPRSLAATNAPASSTRATPRPRAFRSRWSRRKR